MGLQGAALPGRGDTLWKGIEGGKGPAEYGILDSSYQETRRVRAGNGYKGDFHEFLITPRGSALFTIYTRVNNFDLSSVGGSKEGRVRAGIVQEVDIETGDALFEWHSLDHVGLDESYRALPEEAGGPLTTSTSIP